jgi:hypothetical protein
MNLRAHFGQNRIGGLLEYEGKAPGTGVGPNGSADRPQIRQQPVLVIVRPNVDGW